MSGIAVQRLVLWGLAAALFAYLFVDATITRQGLGDPAVATGYWLFGLMILLAVYNLRKRLAMVPLIRSAYWLRLHVAGGVLAIALFWLHTGSIWPNGLYEQVFAVLFYLLSLSGLAGYGMQRVFPRALTQSGMEVIFERIPAHIADLRTRAEAVVVECTGETGSDTLASHYINTMSWFFDRPRFFWAHAVFSRRSSYWLRKQRGAISRYLDERERSFLESLDDLAETKNGIDMHYAYQSLMKRWLLVHVPLAVAVMVMSVWHLLVVNIYAL